VSKACQEPIRWQILQRSVTLTLHEDPYEPQAKVGISLENRCPHGLNQPTAYLPEPVPDEWSATRTKLGCPSSRWPSRSALFRVLRQIGIGAAVTRRPLPHHRAYGSVHGGSSWLR
jgi:hypothetical protein